MSVWGESIDWIVIRSEKLKYPGWWVACRLWARSLFIISSLPRHFYTRPSLGVIVVPGSFMPMISELNTPSYLDKSINFFETLNVTLISLITQSYLQLQSTIICIPCNSINFQIIYYLQFTQWTTMTKPSNEIWRSGMWKCEILFLGLNIYLKHDKIMSLPYFLNIKSVSHSFCENY